MSELIGKTISYYKIIEKLGEGGMGIVYKAEDTRLRRTVALKFLPPHLTKDEEANARFITEAQAASALDHQNICTIHQIDEADDGQMYIVMAYYDGETLAQKIIGAKHSSKNSVTSLNQFAKNASPLPIDDVIDIAGQIAAGLARAHEAGIIHRDIKPSNIMMTERGEVKILDFGIARIAGQKAITKTGSTLGTVAYMSPEQVRGEKTDHRTDIWSLGVVLYEMLTGQQPFDAEYDQAVMYSICHEEPQPVSELCPDVPPELEQIVNKALAKKADERYQKIEELRADVQGESQPAGAKRSASRSRQTQKIRSALLWSFLLFSMIALSVFAYNYFIAEPDNIERIPIVVVDFVNETDEKELDGLSGLMITALEQSPHLSVFTRTRMFDILKQLGKENVGTIDESVGRKICKQANVNVMVTASVRKLGNRYAIDLKVVDPGKEEFLFTTKEDNDGQESIFAMIDDLAEKTRRGLNEFDFQAENIAQITTPSLEAWRHYFEAENLFSQEKVSEAQDQLQKAIALDSTFGLAYYRLAEYSGWSGGYPVDVQALSKKAMSLIDHIPEKEGFLVRASHASSMGQLNWLSEDGYNAAFESSIRILREMERIYPDDKDMLFTLGDDLFHLARYEEALVYFKKVYAVDPDHQELLRHLVELYELTLDYENMYEFAKQYFTISFSWGACLKFITACMFADKYEEGLATLNQYRKLHPDKPFLSAGILYIRMLNDEYQQAGLELEALNDFDSPIPSLLSFELALYQGKYRDALKHAQERLDYFINRKDTLMVIGHHLLRAKILERYDDESAQIEIEKAFRYKTWLTNRQLWYNVDAEIMAGNYQMADSLNNERPVSETLGIRNATLAFRSLILSKQQACTEAAAILARPSLDYLNASFKIHVFYQLAACYFEQGNYDAAIDQLKKASTNYTHSTMRSLYYSRTFYLLGKAYEQQGNITAALENYVKFLDLWKNADADLPELIDAKAMYARLK